MRILQNKIGIHFGACCKPIDEQLFYQGYSIGGEDNMRFQKIADAITLLNLHGIIPDGIANSSRRKLMKIISNCDSIVEDA